MLPLADFQYLEPESIEEAVGLLAQYGRDAMVIGGGTDMLPSMRQGLVSPKYVVSLQAIGGLKRIRWDEDGLTIGPLTTLRMVEADPEVLTRFPFVAQAAHLVASPSVRAMATVGGNICLDTRCNYYNQSAGWRDCSETCSKMGGESCRATTSGRAKTCLAVFSADLSTALVAADAQISLLSTRGERSIALSDFYDTVDGAKPNARAPDELLTSVTIPSRQQGIFGTYLKYCVRNSIDYPLAGVALSLRPNGKNSSFDDIRMVISGISSKPILVSSVAELLNGKPLDPVLIEQAAKLARKAAKPADNLTGDKRHRRLVVYEYAKQALGWALENALTGAFPVIKTERSAP